METKTFEIRDRATFIPALAVRLEPGHDLDPGRDLDRYLLARAGFGLSGDEQREYVVLMRLVTCEAQHDPAVWGGRTMPTAHRFIHDNWDALPSGAVIDVEHILGETAQPKVSERLSEREIA